MKASDIVGSTTDPAFAVDPRGSINAWNEAAERFFGLAASQVLNCRCWEVLKGRDVFGNDYCSQGCQLRMMASQHRPIRPCDLDFDDAMGIPVRAHVSTIRTPADGKNPWSLVHLVSSATHETPRPRSAQGPGNSSLSRLTVREAEVLNLCAEGHGTTRMAEELGLSTTTVRNHIQRILCKLRVHSRLEAVALARRLGLLA